MNFLKIPNKFEIIKLFLIFSYIVCWLSISTSFEDLLILKNNEFDFFIIVNFFRHGLVYFCFLVLTFLIIKYLNILDFKKNIIFCFFILYFLSQFLGLFFSDHSTIIAGQKKMNDFRVENISFIISSLTIIFTLILINKKFEYNEKLLLIYISLAILLIVFFSAFIPQLKQFIIGDHSIYGSMRYGQNEIFFQKYSPRTSGLARTSLIILLIIVVFETKFLKKIPMTTEFTKIFFITSVILFQSRTIIFLLTLALIFMFFYEKKITIKYFIKFLITYCLIPLTLFYLLVTFHKVQAYKSKKGTTEKNIIEILESKDFQSDNFPSGVRSFSKDISSGRFGDWKLIINKIDKKELLIGYGPQGDRYLIYQSASNGLIYAYSSSGLIGLIFFTIFSILSTFQLIKVMLISYKKNKNNFIYSLIVLLMFLRSILESSYAVFSIDLIVVVTFLTFIHDIDINIKTIKEKYFK